jgi:3-dehydroquinate dehydratase
MTKFETLKTGQALSEIQYYKVEKIAGEKVQLKNDFNEMIVVDRKYVEKCLISAHDFSEEQKVSKTEAATIFLQNKGMVMSVNFNKKVDEKAAKESIYELYANKGGKVLSEADYKKKVNAALKSILEGEERTMVGRHFGELNELGRVNFIDMEVEKDPSKEYDNRQRQVDPRTINYMIIKGVKYTVK